MSGSTRQIKNKFRARMRKRLQALPVSVRVRKSSLIYNQVLQSDFYQQARSLAVYVSFKNEVSTHRLIARALKDGKKVFVPCLWQGEMKISQIKNFKIDLMPGPFGILQPRKCHISKIQPDLIFVPGLAFDKSGMRLGRGAGYFDRYLAGLRHTLKIGLAFNEQLVKKVPTEKHDIRVDFVLTA